MILAMIRKGYTDSQLRLTARQMLEASEETQTAGLLLVGGWDNDPRPLVRIPEARQLCKDAIRHGILALLKFNANEAAALVGLEGCPFGGIELWACAHEMCDGDGKILINQEDYDRFQLELDRAGATILSLADRDEWPATLDGLGNWDCDVALPRGRKKP
jgi:hypothetical protein